MKKSFIVFLIYFIQNAAYSQNSVMDEFEVYFFVNTNFYLIDDKKEVFTINSSSDKSISGSILKYNILIDNTSLMLNVTPYLNDDNDEIIWVIETTRHRSSKHHDNKNFKQTHKRMSTMKSNKNNPISIYPLGKDYMIYDSDKKINYMFKVDISYHEYLE